MYKSFENLPEERKKRIIDACLAEFAGNGYEKASTNSIVREAGISKGILFHYFGNKKNLFLYIIDYIMDYMTERFSAMYAKSSDDLFEKLVERGLVKLKLAYENPLMYEILFSAYGNMPDDLKNELQQRYQQLYSSQIPAFLKDIDYSKFRKNIDPEKAVELVLLSLEALNGKYTRMYKDRKPNEMLEEMDKISEEIYEYMEILKDGIYGK